MTQIKGWHVLMWFCMAFAVIIGVNLTLAYQAVRTFPGLEVRNSYIASQSFDTNRTAQTALGWDVSATLTDHTLSLIVLEDGTPVAPVVEQATFGRATNVQFDETPEFTFDGQALRAQVIAGEGNWNLRLKLRAADGTLFQQRVIVEVAP
ncbi:FixH family protein [Sulfitobacter sp. HNIBRBA2951]|uniref:FixH family protein n=1 Tax=Sulfitobacter aquimarinus TaxID=3158557 RepID=UPI0032DE946B